MDPQTAYPHQEDPNNAGMHSGEEEPHHEKQSVMKRVKAKAKKIKHSLTSHGHAPEEHDDHSGEHDEEDDEDEEMAEDPEIHDAPINDSPATKTAPTWGEENLAKAKDTLEMPAVKEEHPQAPVNTSAHSLSPGIHPTRPHGTPVDFAIPQTRSHAPANTTADSFSTETHPTRPPGIPADPVYETHAPVNPSTHTSVPGIHQTGVPDLPSNVDRGQGIAVDPSAPKDRHETHTPSNYQSKVVDPVGAGGEEVGITPIIHSFGKMNVHGESEPKTEHHLPTGTHDQFSSEGHEPLTRSEKQQYKLSSANSAIDKASTARNVPASKLGHASQDPINKSEEQGYDNRDMPQNQSNAGNAPSATSTIAEKAASLKNVVSSKLGYGGQEPIKNSEEQQHENRGYTPGNESHEPINKSEEQSFDSRADKPQNQSTYTGKLSSAAVSAKNVVASKLGYGAKEETHAAPDMHERDVHGDNETAKSPQAGGYGSKIASTLAPVYGKVSGAGSAVMSKLPGTGTGSGTGTGTETNKEGGVVGSDKGASVKEYLVEKSRPGEEDRALSQIITDVLGSKRKEENVEPTGTARRPSREVLSDAIHNRKEESEPGKSSLPMGKVTESEEVKKQLGPGDEDTQNKVALESGKPGEGVVDRLKGAVTSWFGKGGEPQPSEASHDSSHEGTGAFLDTRSGGEVQGQGHEVVGEGRHEESSK